MDLGAVVLAAAYADDPLMTYFWPNAERRGKALPLFWEARIAARAETGMVDLALDEDRNVVSVALWEPVGVISPIAKHFTLVRALRSSLPRALAVSHRMEAARPATPHLYLAAVGTRPDAQRKGFASSLLEQRLATSTEPCFLIANAKTTMPFYDRFGFHPEPELPLDHGPVLYPMRLTR